MSTREEFEKWAARQGYKIGRMEIGAYWSFDTSSAWLAWQAATERANASWASMCEKMVAAEREACAKVCESRRTGGNIREDIEAKRCAEAIRARGN